MHSANRERNYGVEEENRGQIGKVTSRGGQRPSAMAAIADRMAI